MAAFVDIIGWPQGAEILVNEEIIGVLPIYNKMFKWGKYKVEARKEGYVPEVREEFTIWPSERSKTIVFQLKKSAEKPFGE